MISTRAIPDGGINVAKISSTVKSGAYGVYYANSSPRVITNANSYGAPTGTTGDLNFLSTSSLFPVTTLIHVKGTQTLLAPLMEADGLDISQDQTDNDGVEYIFGGSLLSGRNAMAHTVGTTPDSFIRIKA